MFQNTRQFIINDVNGRLKVEKDATNNNVFISKPAGSLTAKFAVDDNDPHKFLYIDNLVNIRKSDVVNVYKTEGEEAKNEKLVITLPTIAANSNILAVGDVVRLVIELEQEGRVIATFNDAFPHHTKSLFYEGKVSTADTLPTDDLLKAVARDVNTSDDQYITISKANSDLVITALDEFTRIKAVRLVKVGVDKQDPLTIGQLLTGHEDFKVLGSVVRGNGTNSVKGFIAEGFTVKTATEQGKLGVGTTKYILHNVQLQTDANLNPYGLDRDERPVPGGVYDQYLVEFVTERRHIAGGVVGSINHSLTSLVFFVLNTGDSDCESVVNPSEIFEAHLTELMGEAPINTATEVQEQNAAKPEAKDAAAEEVVIKKAARKAKQAVVAELEESAQQDEQTSQDEPSNP